MTTYVGDRTIDGVQVLADGEPLDPRLDIHEFTRNGFEWSYEGPEPSQLALALLAHHTGDPKLALALEKPFMRAVVANFDNEWEMTSADIDAVLATIRAPAGEHTPGV
jgi:hypothetical protein